MIHEDYILTWVSHHSIGGSGDVRREAGEVQWFFSDASCPEALLPEDHCSKEPFVGCLGVERWIGPPVSSSALLTNWY